MVDEIELAKAWVAEMDELAVKPVVYWVVVDLLAVIDRQRAELDR